MFDGRGRLAIVWSPECFLDAQRTIERSFGIIVTIILKLCASQIVECRGSRDVLRTADPFDQRQRALEESKGLARFTSGHQRGCEIAHARGQLDVVRRQNPLFVAKRRCGKLARSRLRRLAIADQGLEQQVGGQHGCQRPGAGLPFRPGDQHSGRGLCLLVFARADQRRHVRPRSRRIGFLAWRASPCENADLRRENQADGGTHADPHVEARRFTSSASSCVAGVFCRGRSRPAERTRARSAARSLPLPPALVWLLPWPATAPSPASTA